MSRLMVQSLCLIASTVMFAGCASGLAQPGSANHAQARYGYVDVDRLVAAHPFAGALAEDARLIQTLRAAEDAPHLTQRQIDIEHGRAALNNDFNGASARLRNLVDQKATLYAQREDAAIAALVGQDGANASTAVNLGKLRVNYQRQYDDLRASAQRGMQRYRSALLSQVSSQLSRYAQALRFEANAAYGTLAGNLQSEEAARDLAFVRDHADRRLMIQLKLDTLFLETPERLHLQNELNAMNAQRVNAIKVQQAKDAGVLLRARALLQSGADASYADASKQLHAAAGTNLAMRTRVYDEQSAPAPALPAMPNLHSAVTMLSNYYQARFREDVTSMTNAFVAVQSDLNTRFAAIRSADAAGTKNTRAEVARLQNDRRQLHDEIVAQIMGNAKRVAGEKGLAGVYSSRRQAPPNSVDLTAAVNGSLSVMRI